ncbi:GntR family transcriptional regulator [Corynebacterium comes]|uniref:HTH-type transcriptional repressor DasR n=1 Tax=Corynebacterium comes TaxID=2675218 RepID=A0A6B8VK17_9CORY|nr:GntR family transcriptional regulator [Corynebacterium comes]QGU05732.1 HTH-type transcriptional repressor DasR [Corynebacterium comes]
MAATPRSTRQPDLPATEITDGPVPKHAQLRAILEELCDTRLHPGDLLPGERVLEETYGVSRITVRRAIGDLVISGRLRRARGKGTFVAPNPLFSRLHLASFSSEMEAQNVAASSKILSSARATAPQEVLTFFGGDPRTPHTHLRRLRLGDGEPYSIDDAWYNAEHVPDLLENDVYKSVYSILDEDYQVPVTEADQVVTAVNADDRTASLLDVAPGTALLRIVRLSRSRELPVEWCSSVYRTDRYRLSTRVTRVVE